MGRESQRIEITSRVENIQRKVRLKQTRDIAKEYYVGKGRKDNRYMDRKNNKDNKPHSSSPTSSMKSDCRLAFREFIRKLQMSSITSLYDLTVKIQKSTCFRKFTSIH